MIAWIAARLTCLFHGHLWHEGDDTAVEVDKGFYGTGMKSHAFVWECIRCGTSTAPGEPPPMDKNWDHRWVSPPSKSLPSRYPRNCAHVYRMEVGCYAKNR